MAIYPIFRELSPIEIDLECLYLDPNNPRFVGHDWDYVSDEEIDNPRHQDAALQLLVKRFEIEKISSNMEVNGYLPIDRVIVKEFKKGKYVVLEGNRRISAAKLIVASAKSASQISAEVLSSLKRIPCLLYTGEDRKAAWIFQGIRHITGVAEWSAFNKAKLLVEQMEEEDLSLTEVGKRFGLSPYGANQWVRGYQAFRQAKEKTDYVNEVDERSYPYFQELFGRSNAPLREWLEWDDKEKSFKNELNLDEFVSWLYPREKDEELEGANKRVFQSAQDLRTVSYLISAAPDIFQQFRDSRNLEGTYSIALARKYEQQSKEQADREAEVFEVIKACYRELDHVPFKMLKKPDVRTKLLQELQTLENALLAVKEAINESEA